MALIKLIHIELCKFILSGIAPSDSACVCMYVCTDDVINNRLEILNKGSGRFTGVVSFCFSSLNKAL